MKSIPFVSVIVPAKNEQEFIGECLDSLINQNFNDENYEIIVVDNLSTDDTAVIARTKGVTVLSCDSSNVGGVRNFGALSSRGEVICYIDSDCTAHKNWLSDSVHAVMENEWLAVGGNALSKSTGSWVERYWIFSPRSTPDEDFTLNGSSMFFSRELYLKVGGFNDSINSNEDTSFSNRVKSLGHEVVWLKSADVIHNDYPQNLKDFFVRQVWLSSSYFKTGINNKDKVFFFVLMFILGFFILIFGFSSNSFLSINVGGLFLIVGPALFSIKKIISSVGIKVRYWPVIFLLSFIYFFGRSVGFLYSLTGRAFPRR